eukprot:7531785-Pyramimonas_sp.AAC.1
MRPSPPGARTDPPGPPVADHTHQQACRQKIRSQCKECFIKTCPRRPSPPGARTEDTIAM